jgi:hypothetical protein
LKKIPFFVKLQGDDVPVWQIASLVLGIGGAFALSLPNPVVAGIMAWLAAGKGYDYVKGDVKPPTVP